MDKINTPEQKFDEAFKICDEVRGLVLEFLDKVTQANSEKRPQEQEWSIGEVAHHLILVENRYRDQMIEVIQAGREGQFDQETVQSERSFPLEDSADITKAPKGKASKPVEPSHCLPIDELREQLHQLRAETKSQLLPHRSRELGDLWHEHPRLGAMTLYEKIRLIGYHELKHLAQMKRCLSES